MRRERLYLEDIVTAADAIAEFTYAQNPESFEADLMLRSAVVHQLTVMVKWWRICPRDFAGVTPRFLGPTSKASAISSSTTISESIGKRFGVPQPPGFPSCAPRSPISCAPRFQSDSETRPSPAVH